MLTFSFYLRMVWFDPGYLDKEKINIQGMPSEPVNSEQVITEYAGRVGSDNTDGK